MGRDGDRQPASLYSGKGTVAISPERRPQERSPQSGQDPMGPSPWRVGQGNLTLQRGTRKAQGLSSLDESAVRSAAWGGNAPHCVLQVCCSLS